MFFQELKEKLIRTRENIFGKISELLDGKTILDEGTLDQIEEILITADIGITTSHQILERLKQRVRKEKSFEISHVYELLEEEIEKISGVTAKPLEERVSEYKPFIILIVGVNGVGKTTTIGKLANRFTGDGRKVLLIAGDTFRAAAGGQLEIWAQRSGVEIIRQPEGFDPAAVIFDALASDKAKSANVILIDTAGRLHTKVNLMEELKKITRVIAKQFPSAPHETLLILDGTTGQNALRQAKEFSQVADISGLIITKLDGTAKGGVVLAIQQEIKIPVYYIGVGEGIDDLQQFDIHDFVKAILE